MALTSRMYNLIIWLTIYFFLKNLSSDQRFRWCPNCRFGQIHEGDSGCLKIKCHNCDFCIFRLYFVVVKTVIFAKSAHFSFFGCILWLPKL